jgi:CheY-like chemotaxis protein
MTLPVLVVEDHSINREVAILQLRILGIPSEIARDGQAAIDAVKEREFALILMDVMMPGMDGWEASRHIREYESTIGRHTPIIGLSAWSASDNRERCLAAGMDDYLGKPYEREDLDSIIKKWVKDGEPA